MSTDLPTLGSLLAFDFEEPSEEEMTNLRECARLANGVFQAADGLQTAYWQAAARNAYARLGRVLDRPVSELMTGAWNRYQPFLKYCDAKRYPPGNPVTEHLVAHTIDATITPKLKVLINGTEVGEIVFRLAAALELEGGVLQIDGGRFMSVRPGRCHASATLTCAGHKLIERKSSELHLPGEIRFGRGIPILPDALRVTVPPT